MATENKNDYKDDDDKCDDLINKCKLKKPIKDDKDAKFYQVQTSCSNLDDIVTCLVESIKSPVCKSSLQRNYVHSMKKMKSSVCSEACINSRKKCDTIENICDWWDCTSDALKDCKGRNKRFAFNVKAFIGDLCKLSKIFYF